MTAFLVTLRALGAALFVAGAAAAADGYRVAPGDTVALSLYGHPDLSGDYRVREDGVVALHLIGSIPVAGLTLVEIEAAVADAAGAAFGGDASVIAAMAAWRDVFVIGDVARPGAHPYAPGLTVIQALAVAGGPRRVEMVGGDGSRRIADERRRLLLAQARIDEAEAAIRSIDQELSQLTEAEGLPAEGASPTPDDPAAEAQRLSLQQALIRSRREVVERAVDGARRQRELALEEADLFNRRSDIIARQLRATEENLADIDSLVARGLARRDRQLDLAVEVDDYRADALEIAAFEARARQTAANAENTAAVAISRYRERLVADRLTALQDLESATIEFATSLEYLQLYGDADDVSPTLAPPEEKLEIIRGDQTMAATPESPLRPGDVLRFTLVAPELPSPAGRRLDARGAAGDG